MRLLLLLLFFPLITFSQEGYPEVKFVDGKPHGTFKFWYEEGKISEIGEFDMGIMVGYWKFYNEDGKLWKEGNYKNGEEDGLWKFYDEKGNLVKEENWKDGVIQ
jgi:antitoxin component YwqK of YwqJK toxin-antitoxin module